LAQEDEAAALSYQEFKKGIFESLHPQNQLQTSLAEKVAVDMWRLRKVLRFEAGAIAKEQQALYTYGSDCGTYKEYKLKEELKDLQDQLSDARKILTNTSKKDFNLKKANKHTLFIISNLAYYIYYYSLDLKERDRLSNDEMELDELLEILNITEKEFINTLKDYLENRVPGLENSIEKQEQALADFYRIRDIKRSVAAIPSIENVDKLLKYERSIQRSILHNIAIIHRLQGVG